MAGLLDTLYSYPLTSGLLAQIQQTGPAHALMGLTQPSAFQQSLYQTPAAYAGPDYSQIALQMAGNPHAGPYAAVAMPPAPAGSSAPAGSGTGGSKVGSALSGLLASLAENPKLLTGLGKLLGIGPDVAPSVAAPTALAPSDLSQVPVDALDGVAPDVAPISTGISALAPSDLASVPVDALAGVAPDVAPIAAAPISTGLAALAPGQLASVPVDALSGVAPDVAPIAAPTSSTAAASSAAATDAAGGLAGGLVMSGAGLLAALGDKYLNSSEKGGAEGMAAQTALHDAEGPIYSQLMGRIDTSNPAIAYLTSPNARVLSQYGTPEATGVWYPNPLSAVAALQARNQFGTAGNKTVEQMLNQGIIGYTPDRLYQSLAAQAKDGIPVGAGGWALTGADLSAAGLTPAQIQALGVS